MLRRSFVVLFLVTLLTALPKLVLAQPPEPQPAPPPIGVPAPPPIGVPEFPLGVPVPPPKPPPRPAEPEKQINLDLKDFVWALNSPGAYRASLFVEGGRMGYFGLNEWKQSWDQAVLLEKVQIDKIAGDDAQVTVFYRVDRAQARAWRDGKLQPETPAERALRFANTPLLQEALRLHRRAEDRLAPDAAGLWAVVLDDMETELRKDKNSFCRLALFCKQPPGLIPFLRTEESKQRLLLLGLAVMSLTQDFDEIYAFAPEYSTEALLPYLKAKDSFTVPGTGEQFSFNERLCGRWLGDLHEPAQIVLFYDGHDEKLTFRNNGRAAVCFADGHVKLITPETAKTLRWAP